MVATKNAQSDRIYVSVRIVGLSQEARQQDSALAHRACEMVEFLDRDALFHVPMLLSADMMNIFSSANQIKFTNEAG